MNDINDLPQRLVIAIDGPAGSGKSTMAKLLAKKIGGVHIDTGAMYRSVTAKALDIGVDVSDSAAVAKVAESINITLKRTGEIQKVIVDGADFTARIRQQDVNDNVSIVAAQPLVRRKMAAAQREMGGHGQVVMEGRDIGSAVFPDADFKFYLVANSEIRAERRLKEMESQGHRVSMERVKENIEKRDLIDSSRQDSPLVKPDGAIEIDTSYLSIDEAAQKMIERLVSKP